MCGYLSVIVSRSDGIDKTRDSGSGPGIQDPGLKFQNFRICITHTHTHTHAHIHTHTHTHSHIHKDKTDGERLIQTEILHTRREPYTTS